MRRDDNFTWKFEQSEISDRRKFRDNSRMLFAILRFICSHNSPETNLNPMKNDVANRINNSPSNFCFTTLISAFWHNWPNLNCCLLIHNWLSQTINALLTCFMFTSIKIDRNEWSASKLTQLTDDRSEVRLTWFWAFLFLSS